MAVPKWPTRAKANKRVTNFLDFRPYKAITTHQSSGEGFYQDQIHSRPTQVEEVQLPGAVEGLAAPSTDKELLLFQTKPVTHLEPFPIGKATAEQIEMGEFCSNSRHCVLA